ncbi:hypothetical protein HN011_010681 [Eciton burchellii]|nr:hypothetical protein HN011_010681 [Eciton burchellii]
MSSLDTYELTHPESLSERQLREILKNSCIEIHNFEKLRRNELLEMYKQVAMPFPQRQRAKDSNTAGMTLEKFAIANSTYDSNKGNKRTLHSSCPQMSDKLKPFLNDEKSMPKKIRVCSSKSEVTCNGSKRKCNEQTEELLIKKRQKITWP